MTLSGGGWGHQVGMAALLREGGYLLEGSEGARRRPIEAPAEGAAPRARPGLRALRAVVTGLALLLRFAARG